MASNHPTNEDCDGFANFERCEECEKRLCDCESAYGHDCEV